MIRSISTAGGICRTARRICASVLLTAAMTSQLIAGLKWDAVTLEHVAKVGDDSLQLAFAFSNPDARPVTIVDVKPSCGCTATVLDQRTYAPGEKGVLTVLLDAKGLAGLQEKTIEVFADDSKQPTTLTLRVTIPPWWKFRRNYGGGRWARPPSRGKPIVSLNRGGNFKITSVKTDGLAMEVTLQPTAEQDRFWLVAKPALIATAVQATVTLSLALDGAAPREFVVFAQVR